jgi:hypothetical protein
VSGQDIEAFISVFITSLAYRINNNLVSDPDWMGTKIFKAENTAVCCSVRSCKPTYALHCNKLVIVPHA